MKTFNEIVDNYVNKSNAYYEKRQKLEDKIAKDQERLKKLKMPSWVNDIIVPLAEEIKSRLDKKAYEIYGPFGCECETSIYFSDYGKDGNIEITKVPTLSLTVRPQWKHNDIYTRTTEFKLTYWTGDKTNEYAKGTIGELNGLNNVFAPLPTDIDEIIKLLSENH